MYIDSKAMYVSTYMAFFAELFTFVRRKTIIILHSVKYLTK